MIERYHISSYNYEVGETIIMNSTCNYHNNTMLEHYGLVNDFIDKARPERKKSIYAFDNPDYYIEFFNKQYPAWRSLQTTS